MLGLPQDSMQRDTTMRTALTSTPAKRQKDVGNAIFKLLTIALRQPHFEAQTLYIAQCMHDDHSIRHHQPYSNSFFIALIIHTNHVHFIPPSLTIPVLHRGLNQPDPMRTQFVLTLGYILLWLDKNQQIRIPTLINLFTFLCLSQYPLTDLATLKSLLQRLPLHHNSQLNDIIEMIRCPGYQRSHPLNHNIQFSQPPAPQTSPRSTTSPPPTVVHIDLSNNQPTSLSR